ncbi:MAG TPA: hypothetical protein DEP87_00620, partial [Candidatus Pacebacteria bacterium]|nr:hypothetical protein [Candidatus Paceibacterota bacterium]
MTQIAAPKTNFLPTLILIIGLILLMAGLGYNRWFQPFWNQKASSKSSVVPAPQPRQGATNSAILGNGLAPIQTDREKLTQLLMVSVVTSINSNASGSAKTQIDDATATWLQAEKPGFIKLTSVMNRSQANQVTQSLLKLANDWTWPPLLTVTHFGGSQNLRGQGFETLPTMSQICSAQVASEPALANSAVQLSQLGIAAVIGPVIDVGVNSFQGNQICDNGPEAAEAAGRYIENFSADGIFPIVAHFPGLGQAKQNPLKTIQALATTTSDLKPFKNVFEAYPNVGVLVSPVRVSERFDNLPCTQSAECLISFATTFPDIFVLADGVNSWAALNRTDEQLTLVESMRLSWLAGANVLVFDQTLKLSDLTQALNELELEMKTNSSFQAIINANWQKSIQLRTGAKVQAGA